MSEVSILTAFAKYLENKVALFTTVIIGVLPLGDGICLQISPASDKSEYLDGNALKTLSVLTLVKHSRHRTAMETAFALFNETRKISARLSENGLPDENAVFPQSVSAVSVGENPAFVSGNGTEYIYSFVIDIYYY